MHRFIQTEPFVFRTEVFSMRVVYIEWGRFTSKPHVSYHYVKDKMVMTIASIYFNNQTFYNV